MALIPVQGADQHAMIGSGTTQVVSGAARINGIVAFAAAGTTAVLDIFDDTGSGGDNVFHWVSADYSAANKFIMMDIPCQSGIRIVVSGTPPTITFCYDARASVVV